MRKHPKRHSGFTLVELVVVMGVIALLAGLLLPMAFRAQRSGKRARLAADLQAIETGLNAYKADFGDYPRFPVGYDPANMDVQKDRGARLLCRALLAPGPETGAAATGADGFAGPGFRLRMGGLGKSYGPYIVADKFKITEPLDASAKLLDNEGHIILYYPAKPGNADINTPAAVGFIAEANPATPFTGGPGAAIAPLYDSWDNLMVEATTAKPPANTPLLSTPDMRVIMGDRNKNGYIDLTAPTESAASTAPYLLWSAGVDGGYGLTAKGKTDDVTNFEIAPDLFKN